MDYMKMPGARRKRKILLVTAYAEYPMRAASSEHLYAFRRYAEDDVYYLNLVLKSVPRYVLKVDFDLIVFHTFFLSNHWRGPDHFRKMLKRAAILKDSPAVKVMLPQDEFIYSDLLSEFINEFKIDIVFSVAPPDTWRAIYRKVDFNRVRFSRVLSGYLDEKKLKQIVPPEQSLNNRSIDIGYRTAGKPFYWFGRHGFLKQTIADIFRQRAPSMGLATDISTEQKDAIRGQEWYFFLARCKYTIGVESGTGLIDFNGSIRECTDQYLRKHPFAKMEEVEAACFPGMDGSVPLYAISPRHLECCATRTCQILTEGDYNGILQPGVHYLSLKKDFSNLDDVLHDVVLDQKRSQLVKRAFEDVVASGQYTYKKFVDTIMEQSLAAPSPEIGSRYRRLLTQAIYAWMYAVEAWEHLMMRVFSPLKPFLRKFMRA
jgi:hypothetical protein